MAEVWSIDLAHDEQAVLLAYADHADDAGQNAFPSREYVAWKTGYDERRIQRIVSRLTDMGVLRPTTSTSGGRGKGVIYAVVPSNGVKKPEFTGRRSRRAAYHDESVTVIKGGTGAPLTVIKGGTGAPLTVIKGGTGAPLYDGERGAKTPERGAKIELKGGKNEGCIYKVPVSEPPVEPPIEPSSAPRARRTALSIWIEANTERRGRSPTGLPPDAERKAVEKAQFGKDRFALAVAYYHSDAADAYYRDEDWPFGLFIKQFERILQKAERTKESDGNRTDDHRPERPPSADDIGRAASGDLGGPTPNRGSARRDAIKALDADWESAGKRRTAKLLADHAARQQAGSTEDRGSGAGTVDLPGV